MGKPGGLIFSCAICNDHLDGSISPTFHRQNTPVITEVKVTPANSYRQIRVAHSPDSDDAFMFYALACRKIDTGNLAFIHELRDIETLNRAALQGVYEVSAVSFHAYAYVSGRYVIMPCGASMGDGYGPIVVARTSLSGAPLVFNRAM